MKHLKLIAILIAILIPVSAFAQIERIESQISDGILIDPGYQLADETASKTTLFTGWFDVIYMQEFGEAEPFEIDLEGVWSLYETGPWSFELYAGIFILNMPPAEPEHNPDFLPTSNAGEFHTARELGVTTFYNLETNPEDDPRGNMQLGLYGGKISGEVTNGGTFFKFFVQDQLIKGDKVPVGGINYGWKALIAYNNQYFLDDTGISHLQGQAWISYRATEQLDLIGRVAKQVGLMDQFEDHSQFSLAASYNF